ncbi:MFS transporter [Bacillus sp. FJAT-42376]|uniref:MDR family MFS transporter n=1 Tax=Bacillus sp. FJAT-42376 TaxID=2014076 RepID=UPI000F4EDC96|nr:MFS transporter [Bacillus sp. FJAT-42376]AZB41334.1 MFS transporter [Bacillus sp. FJAT-42376]
MNSLRMVHPIAWNIIIGTLFSRMATSMSIPFLAIYLTGKLNVSASVTGAIIASSSIVGIAASFYGGYLSDRFGQKPVLLISIFTWSLVFIGFAQSSAVWMFFVMNALNGLCRAVFEPTSRAILSDVTEEKNRLVLFNLRYTAINIGVVFGPIIGLQLGSSTALTPFYYAAGASFLYGLSLVYMLSVHRIGKASSAKGIVSVKEAFGVLKKDTVFSLGLAGIILSVAGYSQFSSTLPQFFAMSPKIENGAQFFSLMLTLNAVVVIVFQYPLIQFGKKYSPVLSIMLGNILVSISLLGFSLTDGLLGILGIVVLFTMGEVLMFCMTDLFADQLAKPGLKGSYFGAMGFTGIGNVIGPFAGGMMLDSFGASKPLLLFGSLALLTALGIPFLYKVYKMSRLKPVSAPVKEKALQH